MRMGVASILFGWEGVLSGSSIHLIKALIPFGDLRDRTTHKMSVITFFHSGAYICISNN